MVSIYRERIELIEIKGAIIMAKGILANIFVDGVVLQRDLPIKFWGKIDPVTAVTINFDGANYETVANEEGTWEMTVPAMPAGKGYELKVSSEDMVQTVKDILVGDVWICAGQSNMELPMARVKRMFADKIKNSNNPNIRQYHLPLTSDFWNKSDIIPESLWISVEPGQTEKFSATGFFFANKLQEELDVPIGLVMTAIGGTPVEAWMSREALSDYPEALAMADECRQDGYMDEVTVSEQKAHEDWFKNLTKFDRGLNEQWFKESFTDEDWKTIDLNVSWDEVTDLKASGSVWLRKEVEISENLASQSADIILGCIVDADEVYLNGVKIGETGYRYPPRDYKIPNLKVGKNTIAIRIVVTNQIGGFIFGKEHKLLFADKTEIMITDEWKYKRSVSCPQAPGLTFFQYRPTGNYNGMIHPLHNYPIKGIIWYQGESNAGNPKQYSQKFGKMITDWRERWNQGNFPFIFAQLSNWSPKGNLMNWELLREEQTKILATTPNTRMVVTNDVGEYNDLHPLDKKSVGERLAGEALSLAYDMDIVATGPTLSTIEKLEDQFILHFETGKSMLTLKNGAVVYGLSIWINDIEIPVEGTINGITVVIKTPHANKVTTISYAWVDDPTDANLYNDFGLPAVQFKKEVQ